MVSSLSLELIKPVGGRRAEDATLCTIIDTQATIEGRDELRSVA